MVTEFHKLQESNYTSFQIETYAKGIKNRRKRNTLQRSIKLLQSVNKTIKYLSTEIDYQRCLTKSLKKNRMLCLSIRFKVESL